MKPKTHDEMLEHARRELIIAGVQPEEMERYISVLDACCKAGFDGNRDPYESGISLVLQLLGGQTLTPLTDSPEEWELILEESTEHPGLWRNIRKPEALSYDGGKTYHTGESMRRTMPTEVIEEHNSISVETSELFTVNESETDEVSSEGD